MKNILIITAIILSSTVQLVCANGMPYTEDKKTEKNISGQDSGLSKEKQELLQHTMQKNYENNKGNYEKLRTLHNEMGALMVAAQFDKDIYTRKSAEALAIENAIETSKIEAIASIASQFSPAERKALAETLERRNYFHKKKYAEPAESKDKDIDIGDKILD